MGVVIYFCYLLSRALRVSSMPQECGLKRPKVVKGDGGTLCTGYRVLKETEGVGFGVIAHACKFI